MARAIASNITAKLASLMAMVILALALSTAPALAEEVVEGGEVVGAETTQVLENETETVAETNDSTDGLDVSGATETTASTETGTENASSEVTEIVKSDTVGEDTPEASESAVEPNEAENTPEATNNALEVQDADDSQASETAIDTGDFEVSGDGSYSFDNGVLTINGGKVTVKNKDASQATGNRIVVAKDSELTLAGVNIDIIAAYGDKSNGDPAAKSAAIKILAGVSAIFHLQGENFVKGGVIYEVDSSGNYVIKNGSRVLEYGYAAIEVGWLSGDNYAHLTIDGDGKLVAQGGGGAGIGGSKSANGVYGDITINSGTIVATGGERSAGIGSSNNPLDGTSHGSYKYTDEQWGKITINGGNITAKGVGNGAGIGGGNHTSSGKIEINGGTIYAEGDTGIGAGLGSSSGADKGPGYYYADVTINGGDVTAYATNNMGAGIGGGMYSDAYVKINGGTVTASVNTNGKEYQGGAGIGGGYQGVAVVTITGGTVTATGGNGSPGIGNGALGSVTTTKTLDGNGEPTGTKSVRTGKPTIASGKSSVTITGGTVTAQGGKFGAGIGSGNATEWATILITGGDVTAIGYLSSKDEMEGGAGIGSGVPSSHDKPDYYRSTDSTVDITGGNILAIGGWGASAIGSGANNTQAILVTIDATKANIEAYADGTKFAIDTRVVTEDGKTESADNTKVEGNILQGTFVHAGKIGDKVQSPEGLPTVQVINESTGETKNLTGMGDYDLKGYRSFATTVDAPGSYSVYTDAETIGEGEGRFFARCYTDKWNPEEAIYDAHYVVSEGKLSDNNYLFPVKAIVITKVVRDTQGNPIPGLNGTFYFALWVNDATKPAGGYYITRSDGSIWTEKVEVVAGVALNRAIFAGLNDMTYSVWEVKDAAAREDMIVSATSPVAFGAWNLVNVATTDTVGTGNKGTLNEKTWSQYVTVYNTFVAVNSEPTGPTTPEDPAEPEVVTDDPVPAAPAPQTPAAPVVPAPVAPAAPVVVPAAAVIAPAAAPAVAAIVDDATPLAAAPEAIDDDATPLAGFEDEGCWVHPWIILGTLITAIYSLVVLYRRRHSHNTLGDYEEQVLGEETQDVPAGAPAPVMA